MIVEDGFLWKLWSSVIFWLLILYKSLDLGDSGSVEISHREQCFILRILRVTYLFRTLVKNAFRKIKVRLPNSFDKEFLI